MALGPPWISQFLGVLLPRSFCGIFTRNVKSLCTPKKVALTLAPSKYKVEKYFFKYVYN